MENSINSVKRKIKDIFEPLLYPDEYVLIEVFEFKDDNGNGIWRKVAEADISNWSVEELNVVQKLYEMTNRRFKYLIDKRKQK